MSQPLVAIGLEHPVSFLIRTIVKDTISTYSIRLNLRLLLLLLHFILLNQISSILLLFSSFDFLFLITVTRLPLSIFVLRFQNFAHIRIIYFISAVLKDLLDLGYLEQGLPLSETFPPSQRARSKLLRAILDV